MFNLFLTTAFVENRPEVDSIFPLTPQALLRDRRVVELPRVIVKVSTLETIPDVWLLNSYLVLSNRCIGFIKDFGETHFQEFPIMFRDRKRKQDAQSFRIIHLLDFIECMDKKKSKFEEDEEGFVGEVWKLVLRDGVIPPDRHFFRLKEESSLVLMRNELAEILQKNGVTGALLVPTEKLNFRV